MKYGISSNSYNLIQSALGQFSEIEKVIIYGSRAMGNFKPGSDIDLALFGNKINSEIIPKIKILLEQELPVPYFFDLTHYESLTNLELKKHIDTFGKLFYLRKPENSEK